MAECGWKSWHVVGAFYRKFDVNLSLAMRMSWGSNQKKKKKKKAKIKSKIPPHAAIYVELVVCMYVCECGRIGYSCHKAETTGHKMKYVLNLFLEVGEGRLNTFATTTFNNIFVANRLYLAFYCRAMNVRLLATLNSRVKNPVEPLCSEKKLNYGLMDSRSCKWICSCCLLTQLNPDTHIHTHICEWQ